MEYKQIYELILISCFFASMFVSQIQGKDFKPLQVVSGLTSSSSSSIRQVKPTSTDQGSLNNESKDILVLMPTSLNMSNSNELFFAQPDLFKLDTSVLFNRNKANDEIAPETDDNFKDKRIARKINFLRGGMWKKPKISPLYLINGTVCRFVNSAPICTTLSTTGLLANNNTSSASSSSSSVFGDGNRGSLVQLQPLNGNPQFQTNQQQQFSNNNQQLPYNNNNNQQQFVNNQLNRQQPRPQAVIEDESQDMNLESSINVTEISPTSVTKDQHQHQQTLSRPSVSYATSNMMQNNARPVSLIVNRRPGLNLFPLRRPVRQLQMKSGRAVLQS